MTREIESNPNFDQLFAANYTALTRLVCRVVGDIGWAEELSAEAFWKPHCNPPASDHNLVRWLYRTGIRLAFDNLRTRSRLEQRRIASAGRPKLSSIYGTSTIGACQNAAFCPVGSSIVTWQSYFPGAKSPSARLN